MNIEKLKKKIQKVIDEFPTEVTIMKRTFNKYKEPTDPVEVVTVTGFFADGDSNVSIKKDTGTGGTTITRKVKMLMLVYDEKSTLIKEGHYFVVNGIEYEIIDLGEQFKAYFTMTTPRKYSS